MDTKTKIVDINELYKLIPEAQNLEGKQFNDIKDLLITLIEVIERSGRWEFIQYLSSSKPSLFIVRKAVNQVGNIKPIIDNMQRKIDYLSHMICDENPENSDVYNEPMNKVYNDPPVPSYEETNNYVEEDNTETEDIQEKPDDQIPSTKLPWEQ